MMAGLFWLDFCNGMSHSKRFLHYSSIALQRVPENVNEVSGLMIMGIAGGAVILPVMGVISDLIGQIGGLLILLGTMIYLFLSALSLNRAD